MKVKCQQAATKSKVLSLTNCVAILYRLSVCPGKVRPTEHPEMLDRLKKEAIVKALLKFWLQYTHELLVYCCIHQVVVKVNIEIVYEQCTL